MKIKVTIFGHFLKYFLIDLNISIFFYDLINRNTFEYISFC